MAEASKAVSAEPVAGGVAASPPAAGLAVDDITGPWCLLRRAFYIPVSCMRGTFEKVDDDTFKINGCKTRLSIIPCPMLSCCTFRRSKNDPNHFDEYWGECRAHPATKRGDYYFTSADETSYFCCGSTDQHCCGVTGWKRK